MPKRGSSFKENSKFENVDRHSPNAAQAGDFVSAAQKNARDSKRRHTQQMPRTGDAFQTSDLNLAHLQLEMSRIDMMLALAVERWQRAGRDPNDAFRGLVVTDEEVGELLALPFASHWGDLPHVYPDAAETAAVAQMAEDVGAEVAALASHAAEQGQMLALHHLAQVFELTALEMDALLLALAPALDLRYEQLYSYLQNDINRKRPTVSLLLNLLCAPGAERLAGLARFGQDAALFRHSLFEAVVEPGVTQPSVLSQGVAVDRTVVAWLLGSYQPHADLAPFLRLHERGASAEDRLLAGPYVETLEHIAHGQQPLLLFFGPDVAAQKAAAKHLAQSMQQPLLMMDMAGLLASGLPVASLFRIVLRDARLLDAVVLLEDWDACLQDQETPAHLLAEMYQHPGPIVVAGRQSWQPRGMERRRSVTPLTFELPDYAQRKLLWAYYLEQSADTESRADGAVAQAAMTNRQNGESKQEEAVNVDLSKIDPVEMAGQFTLSSAQIRDAVAAGLDQAGRRRMPLAQEDLYWGARLHSGVRLADLARKITPRYTWEDLILPSDQIEILRELVATVRGRSKVLEEWGLGRKLAGSAAVTVLFAGPPGTGKTMSGEVLAHDLGLDLYKIDLSNMVSKYIGETEKNLERVFSEAQSSNAILFFDEADAIFGKRAGVKDARDRYANIEVSYLLQRMEYYDGVTILATNLRSNIDEAFLRRLQFAVDIPFPDEKDRLRIWETLLPADVPRAPDLPLEEMAKRFKLAGGNIRNIILGAAYLAANDSDEIRTEHLIHATRREFQKMGRLVPDDEL